MWTAICISISSAERGDERGHANPGAGGVRDQLGELSHALDFQTESPKLVKPCRSDAAP
jgi:hypothetical protein